MQPQILVVSDPPHHEVDHGAVAEILGLALVDTTPKIDFAAPEVLLASDPHPATSVADSLRSAGLNVVVIDGHDLAKVPWPGLASSFSFGEGLIVRLAGDEVRLPYDTPLFGVYCKPPADFPTGGPAGAAVSGATERSGNNGFAITEAIEWMPRLDLYFTHDGELRRVAIVQDVTDFGGLGDQTQPTGADNMAATVLECERRFSRIDLDTRLENVRPRQRFLGGEVEFDIDLRKLFSFGTLLLRQVLDSVSPELRDVSQYELGSRLSYLISLQRKDAIGH